MIKKNLKKKPKFDEHWAKKYNTWPEFDQNWSDTNDMLAIFRISEIAMNPSVGFLVGL